MLHLSLSVSRTTRLLASLAVVALVAACIEWDRSTNTETHDIREYVSAVLTTSHRPATFVPGTPPAAGGGPTLTADLPAIVLKGGAATVNFTSPTPFSRVIVAVGGVTGYYDLDLLQEVTSVQLVIVYAQEVGAPSFDLLYAGALGGSLGAFDSHSTAFLGNGTGEVQVNITWNSTADVDLYVVDPLGEEIYYADRNSASGGILDIDSNAACGTDGPRAENIFWPFGVVPPRGEYTVRVNYWSACGEPFTDYVVTIRTQGGIPQTFTGRLTGPGVGGAVGAGYRLGDFTY